MCVLFLGAYLTSQAQLKFGAKAGLNYNSTGNLENSINNIKEGADGMKFDDPGWLGSLLDQVRPMLLKRLIRKEESE